MTFFNQKILSSRFRQAIEVFKNPEAPLPSTIFALHTIITVPLVAIGIFALQTGGFIVYLHEKILFFSMGTILYSLLAHRGIPKKQQPHYTDWIRLLGATQVGLWILPIIALLNLINVVFFQFSHIVLIMTAGMTLVVSFRFLWKKQQLPLLTALGIVVIAGLITGGVFFLIEKFLITNPWELLLQYQANAPR